MSHKSSDQCERKALCRVHLMHTPVTAHHSFIKGGEEDMEDEASLDQFGIVTKGRKFSSRSVVAENEAESNEKPRRSKVRFMTKRAS